jgi:hypothetical protein
MSTTFPAAARSNRGERIKGGGAKRSEQGEGLETEDIKNNPARELRKNQTDAEILLWYRLRNRQIEGVLENITAFVKQNFHPHLTSPIEGEE